MFWNWPDEDTTTICNKPSQPIGSIGGFVGEWMGFETWADDICMEKVSIVANGPGCYTFAGGHTANSFAYRLL